MTTELQTLIDTTVNDFIKTFKIEFSNRDLIVQALKHRSFLMITNEAKTSSNERLEFLGDAVLDLVMTNFLYQNFPDLPEGDLSKKKAILVSKKVLGKIAADLNLGQFILMNKGEEKTGGRTRLKLLANTFESVVGAIYLDKGYDEAKRFIDENLIPHHEDFVDDNDLQNYKSELLELVQQFEDVFPVYELIEERGPDHEKHFLVQVKVFDKVLAEGRGRSKKSAEQIAAKTALENLRSGSIQFAISE